MARAIAAFIIFISLFKPFDAFNQSPTDDKAVKNTFSDRDRWVDSVMASMSEEQRIGQLFMVAAYSNKTDKHIKELEDLITNYNIGGLIFFQGGPVRQANLTNHYQSIAKVPLLISMDAEWGLGMRLDSTISFPKQMTLGAIQDNSHIYKMGAEIARECRRLGVHVNFAPVVDINSNPANPVIGVRSFGEDKKNVAEKGIAYMKGMQDNKVMANAKHFPGHGESDSDSHLSLPVINHSKERMSEVELYPFRELIKDSLMSIMVAHLHVPAYDNTPNTATTLSKTVVTDLLKKEMGFKGLVFTDALNMKGVSSFYKPGEVDVLALLAGNDVLLYAENVPLAIKKIQKAIKDEEITREEVESRVRKILEAKYWAGLNNYKPVDTNHLYEDLNSVKAKAIQQELYEKALTLVLNKDGLLPVKFPDTTSFACVSIGTENGNAFQKMLDKYGAFTHYAIPNKFADQTYYNQILEQLKPYEVVVVGIHHTNNFNNKDHGISQPTKDFIESLQKSKKVILTVFGSPYALKYFSDSRTLICGYEDNDITRQLVPQLIFGGIQAEGKLPVNVNEKITLGKGIKTTERVKRISYGFPEMEGMNSNELVKIDSIINDAIGNGAMPGCQIMALRNGRVVYNKTFGNLTYENGQPVNDNTVYDIASISKVAGTLQAVMFLYERGLINLDKKASYYLPELKGTNKEDIVIRDILTHQAGLVPFIPHWKRTIDSGSFSKRYYSPVKSDSFACEVVNGLYCISSIEDSLWKWTIESDMLKKPKKTKKNKNPTYSYVYSDLGFYIMKRIVESVINQPLDEFMAQNFYSPLGLQYLTYKPLRKIPVEKIAPTEQDIYFRKTLIRGNVHDQGAAMLGGVGGHAGIFSNATDLAILMQMNLWNGTYGGTRYLLPETVPYFAAKQFSRNRRGLGWDKPEPSGGGPTSDYASKLTFGHTGFTGTAAWVDPESNLVFIFLSNRVYPDANNNKLIKMGIRTKVMDVLYRSMAETTKDENLSVDTK